MPISVDTTLADLATRVPGAAEVLERHRLDYCCHGQQTLADACAERRLDAAAVAAEIAATEPAADEVRWDEAPLPALVAHVLERYHARLREEMPRLVALAAKVEAVHAEKPTCPHGLADHLRAMEQAIEMHLEKEERVLFPLIAAGRGALAAMPIRCMVYEHESHGAALARVRGITADLTPPPEACATWRALYLGLGALERDLHEHIHLENHVLFPRALGA
ncbi:MAG TPA: iron-sulfur cluster repair protein YtfE [Candidatus Binatia bacterium]|nr:iron-sulfur cluster repair protein YtfE [Candidatus Binatia bacterium]